MKTRLRLDWCSRDAAKYAVEHWHYSRKLPASKIVTIGVWEDDGFVGAVVFGRGASPALYRQMKMEQTELVELVRVALRKHETPVSKIVSIALKMLHRHCPGVRMVVSFADVVRQGHLGTIYQASNWIYLGATKQTDLIVNGTPKHDRTKKWMIWNRDPTARIERTHYVLHKYVFCFDRAHRRFWSALAQPYPKSADQLVDGGRPASRAGSTPSSALQKEEVA